MTYPDNCIKGITHPDYLSKDHVSVRTHLFYFNEKEPENIERTDGWDEQSINWGDDSAAVQFTMKQTNSDGEPLFRVGVGLFPRSELDRLSSLKRPEINGILSYERNTLPDNRYHGNLLLRKLTPKDIMIQIAGALALCTEVKLRD